MGSGEGVALPPASLTMLRGRGLRKDYAQREVRRMIEIGRIKHGGGRTPVGVKIAEVGSFRAFAYWLILYIYQPLSTPTHYLCTTYR
jgi:hypothetical protein